MKKNLTIKEIIDILKTMPQDAEMGCLWDGACRSTVDGIYLAKSGVVVGAPYEEPAYYDEDRPEGAPLEKDDPYYSPVKV